MLKENNFSCLITPSPTLAMSERARILAKQGHEVINLSVGEPDTPVPTWVQQAACQAIQQGMHLYTPTAGADYLRQAVVDKLLRDNNLSGYSPSQVCVSTGAKQVLHNILMVTLEPGDGVIIPAPFWVSYPTMVTMAGGVPMVIPCGQTDGFKLSASALERAITPSTKWVILNSPSNPSGAVYTASELEQWAEVLRRNPHVGIISDDIYEHLVYAPHTFVSLAAIAPDLRDRLILVNGVSKSFCMTGWRVGYGIGPQPLIDAMIKFQSHTTSGTCCVAQWACAAALNHPEHATLFLQQQRDLFAKRRDLLVHGLRQAGMDLDMPQGAFYTYANVQNVMQRRGVVSDVMLAHRLLDEVFVSTVPGTEFGLPGYLRLSYALDDNSLRQAVQRLSEWANA